MAISTTMSVHLTPFAIDSSNRMFYNAKDICAHHPALFKGIRSKIREIVARRRIPSSEYLYASFSSRLNRWAVSDSDSTKAQLLISRTWVDHNMLAIPEPIVIHTNHAAKTKNTIFDGSDDEYNEYGKEELIDEHIIAPPIESHCLELNVDNNLDIHINVFKSYPDGFPCIYLLKLGKVEELSDTFSFTETVDNNFIIYKFGCSRDFNKRLRQHRNKYGKLTNVNIEVEAFHYIDPQYTRKAESEIRNTLGAYGVRLTVQRYSELIALDSTHLKKVKLDYAKIGKEYTGATENMQQQLHNAMQENRALQHQNELMKETAEKEKWRERAQTLEQLRTLEISNLELQLQLFKKE